MEEKREKRRERRKGKKRTDVRPGPTARDDLKAAHALGNGRSDGRQFYGNHAKRGES